MTAAERLPLISIEEYLAGETDGAVRHEYVGGYVHAMAGAKNVHNVIATNFLVAVGSQLRGKPCQAMNSDVKVRIQRGSQTRFYYPDGMIVCEPNPPEETFQDRPVVIAEVISDATRRTDTIEKRDAYLTIPTLAAYLLIESDRPNVTVWRRDAEASVGSAAGAEAFLTEVYADLEAQIALPEVDAALALAELYDRVAFDAA